jgi:tRNA nucleotidyltransferase (CCA-adding enzyme)
MRRRLNLFLKKLYRVRPFINGKTLHEMGVKPGPIVGEILNSLLSARLDGIIKTRKEEEQMVGQFLKNQFIEQNGR